MRIISHIVHSPTVRTTRAAVALAPAARDAILTRRAPRNAQAVATTALGAAMLLAAVTAPGQAVATPAQPGPALAAAVAAGTAPTMAAAAAPAIAAAAAPAPARIAPDLAAGQHTFTLCASCHQIGGTAGAAFGPQLTGIVGRPAASTRDFAYSPAMKASKIVWTEQNLAAFLRDPGKVVPGTKMRFWGLSDERQIANLIAYLKSVK